MCIQNVLQMIETQTNVSPHSLLCLWVQDKPAIMKV